MASLSLSLPLLSCIAKKRRKKNQRGREEETGESVFFLCLRACAFAWESAKFRFEEEKKREELLLLSPSAACRSRRLAPFHQSKTRIILQRYVLNQFFTATSIVRHGFCRIGKKQNCTAVGSAVLIVALIGILPLTPRQLQYKGYRLSLLGTTCTTGYALFAFYRLPRAGNMHAAQIFHHVASSKDFIPFMYCLMFVMSKLHLKLVLVPVICWALEHVARFLRRHFTNSSLYRTYLEKPCTWVETNTTAVNFLSSNAEILLGFLLILSLFSRQRNAMQTFMYWQLLKLMYHSPFTAGYHRAIWLKIGRTVNPYIHRYTPFLHDPINAGMRWWFR
uniref:Uncharacterized protein n=1 Tax=Oryza punctata TaxID=4537 RepID=A0A0E0JLM3_ORYPU